MEIGTIKKLYLKLRYDSEIILAQLETSALNILGLVIELTLKLAWQYYKPFQNINALNYQSNLSKKMKNKENVTTITLHARHKK